MAEIKEAKISDLVFDDKNFNKHTEYGMSLIEKSIRNNGAGRSILIDKNNRIIAGNGVTEIAGQIGLDDVQIVESDGTKIIAVKRTDIDLDSKQGREMALADNATARALAEKLKSGSITVEMKANGFEHYGSLGFSLDRYDEQITAISGDIMLYNGNNICVFYGSNSWSYTPLGKMDRKTADELKAFFGTGTISVTYSLKQ
jgi:hypothetical protein